jgi:ribonuclease J
MSEKKLRILPLGGLGEVGKNMTVLEYGRNIIIIDVGLMFPEFDMLGVDHLIPDTTYLNDKSDLIRGIVFTHGHEDHVGAIEHFLDQFQNIPMYASPFTCGIVERKLTAKQKELNPLTEVLPGDKVKIGPFDIEFFRVCHSIPDSCGLGITTPVGLIVHMGDFKLDNTPVDRHITDLAKLSEFGRRGVLALLSDSTNADKPGWNPSEAVIDGAFSQIFAEAKGRIFGWLVLVANVARATSY